MSSAVSYAVWALLAVCTLVLWGASYADRTRHAVARPSVVLERLVTSPWLRVVVVVGWMWIGYHLFAR